MKWGIIIIFNHSYLSAHHAHSLPPPSYDFNSTIPFSPGLQLNNAQCENTGNYVAKPVSLSPFYSSWLNVCWCSIEMPLLQSNQNCCWSSRFEIKLFFQWCSLIHKWTAHKSFSGISMCRWTVMNKMFFFMKRLKLVTSSFHTKRFRHLFSTAPNS